MEFILEAGAARPDEAGWSADLHHPGGRVSRLEIEWPGIRIAAPAVLDGVAAAALPVVMRAGGALKIRGAITRGALRNLSELAEAWTSWRPGRFHRVLLTQKKRTKTVKRPKRASL